MMLLFSYLFTAKVSQYELEIWLITSLWLCVRAVLVDWRIVVAQHTALTFVAFTFFTITFLCTVSFYQ
jgi:hypothetical protein